MSVIYVVLPLALVIAAGMVWAFVRSVRKGQFDDLETPAIRMLFDDSPIPRGSVKPGASKKPEPTAPSETSSQA
jgi:cbb3-type cytochrome oxidase maturation protein